MSPPCGGITEVVDLVADRMSSLHGVGELARLVWVILDGTQIPIDRIADQKPYYNGRKHRHTVNAQFPADARGRPRWVSLALTGAIQDIAAARHHHVPELLTPARHRLPGPLGIPRCRADDRQPVQAASAIVG